MEYTESPYQNIPEELSNQYTLNKKIPILHWWLDGSNDLSNIEWDDQYVKSFTDRFTPVNIKSKKHGKEPYSGASLLLMSAFDKYNITGKNVAVIGSTSPWIEAILLNLNNQVTTIEYNVPQNCNKIVCKSYWDFEKTKNLYDCIVTFSSIEHSGLGRYGDPLDPDGDLKTMTAIHNNLKSNRLLIWGAPVGHDALVWNVHRVYGKIRLPILFKDFEEVEWFGHKKSKLLNKHLAKNGKQPVVVLKKNNYNN